MTRIFTVGLESQTENGGAYLVVLVAHRDSRHAKEVAKLEAGKHGGKWRLAHLTERRTSLSIPRGEVLGARGPISFEIDTN